MRQALLLTDVDATATFAAALAPLLAEGDVVGLEGELGAGKTELARRLIQARAGAPIEVPSPTFTLVQVYDLPSLTLTHADLYRLGDPDEVRELGLGEAWATGCLLVEWPECAQDLLPAGRLTLRLEEVDGQPGARTLHVEGEAAWWRRLAPLRGCFGA